MCVLVVLNDQVVIYPLSNLWTTATKLVWAKDIVEMQPMIKTYFLPEINTLLTLGRHEVASQSSLCVRSIINST